MGWAIGASLKSLRTQHATMYRVVSHFFPYAHIVQGLEKVARREKKDHVSELKQAAQAAVQKTEESTPHSAPRIPCCSPHRTKTTVMLGRQRNTKIKFKKGETEIQTTAASAASRPVPSANIRRKAARTHEVS